MKLDFPRPARHARSAMGLALLLAACFACSDAVDPASLEHAEVFAGARSACALSLEGRLFCWGDNAHGQLALAEDRVLVPTPLDGNPEFSLAAVGTSTCAVGTAGSFCWGSGEFGTLGNGATGDRRLPQAVRGSIEFRELSTGPWASCGIATDSVAYCWGTGERVGVVPPEQPVGPWASCQSFGELCATEPVAVDPERRFVSVTAGDMHACGVDAEGAGWCWGDAFLGDGRGFGIIPPGSLVPVRVSGDLDLAGLEAGEGTLTCGLTALGKAWCWGYVESSMPPRDVAWQSTVPVAVAGDYTFSDIAVGAQHACGVTPGGTAWCWGANAAGVLGDGTTDDAMEDGQFVPVVAGSGMQFRSITAGTDFTCGRTFGGEIWCWGANARGQLGNGTITASLVPVRISAP